MNRQKPSFAEEKALRNAGFQFIAGVDEVGRGALVGPVMAAAVILPANVRARWKSRVRDSKQLTPEAREYLFDFIRDAAVAVGVGEASSEVIDTVGIAKATRLAMLSAVRNLTPQPQYLLIDYVKLKESALPQKGIVHGDSLCFSIACASIIAKVTRDRLMQEMDKSFPGYGFAGHKGYGTEEHLKRLREKGPCPLHRRSFSPVAVAALGWRL
ncbi:MAG: ribonuclease HII [Dehalococcoidales bacterium]